MTVYRITHKKYAGQLTASGIENRWNLGGEFVLYTSTSRSLACLENLVYTSGETLGSGLYVCVTILIPGNASATIISSKDLPNNYSSEKGKDITQAIGDKWYREKKDLILQVPSVIIAEENNIVINTMHKDFTLAKIISKQPFLFDDRLVK